MALAGCEFQNQASQQRHMFVLSGPMMGSDYRITVVTKTVVDQQLIHQQVLAAMNSVNESMSTYLASSEINTINAALAGQEITLSAQLSSVLKEAMRVSQITEGAFDITVAPVVDLWGFGPAGAINQQPSTNEIKELSDWVGYQKIVLRDNTLLKQHSKTRVDLSAIAKGYAVDRVAQTLERNGVHDYLINIGGELRAAGRNVDDLVWRVGIEKPEMMGGIQQIINLDNMAVATSGDYLNFVVFDEQRYSHTIDPKTLSPVLHKLALVSVIHQNASSADALATAMMVMGEEQAFEFAQQQNLAAFLVVRDQHGDGVQIQFTEQFAAYIND